MTPHHSGHGGKGVWPVPGMSGTSLLLVLSAMAAGTLGQFFRPDPRFANSSALTFTVVPAEVAWWQANMHRNHGDGRLAILSPALREFLLATPGRFSQWHWIGASRLPTRWTWLDGSELLKSRGHVSTEGLSPNYTMAYWNEAFTCLLLCDSPYVAVQDVRCYCFNDYPAHRSLSLPNPSCPSDIYCVGDDDGGSLYENTLSPGFSWKLAADRNEAVTGRWGYIQGNTDTGKVELLATDRQDENRYYSCKKGDGASTRMRWFDCSGKLCAYDGVRRREWAESQERCKLYSNTFLASLTSTDVRDLLQVTKNWREYWVGLSRSHVWKNVDGTEMLEAPESRSLAPKACLAVKVQQFGFGDYAVYAMPSDCSVSLPFLLEIAPSSPSVTSPSSISSTSPLATSTSATSTLESVPESTPVPSTSPTPTEAGGQNSSLPVQPFTSAPNAAVGSTDTVGLGVGLAVGLLVLLGLAVAFVFFARRLGFLEKIKHKNQGGVTELNNRSDLRLDGQRLSNPSVTSSHPILDSAGYFTGHIPPPQYNTVVEANGAYYSNESVACDAPPNYDDAHELDSEASFDDDDDDDFDSGPVYVDVDGEGQDDILAAKLASSAPGGSYFMLEPESVYQNSSEPIYDVTPDDVYEIGQVPGDSDVTAVTSSMTRETLSSDGVSPPPGYSLAKAPCEASGLVYELAAAENYVNQAELGISSQPPALPPRNVTSKLVSIPRDAADENCAASQNSEETPTNREADGGQAQNGDHAHSGDHAPVDGHAPNKDVNSYDVAGVGGRSKGLNKHLYSRLGVVTLEGGDSTYDHALSNTAGPCVQDQTYEEVAVAGMNGAFYSHFDGEDCSSA